MALSDLPDIPTPVAKNPALGDGDQPPEAYTEAFTTPVKENIEGIRDELTGALGSFDTLAARFDAVPSKDILAANTAPATNIDAQLADALAEAKLAVRTADFAVTADPLGTLVITLDEGDYQVTDLDAIALDVTGNTIGASKAAGFRFKGAGKDVTRIVYDPASASSFIRNSRWINVHVSDMTIQAATTGCTFFDSRTIWNAQAFTFENVSMSGFTKLYDLHGNNNNSEIRSVNCDFYWVPEDGDVLFVAASDGTNTVTDTSDQFLNYWFINCKFWDSDGDFVDMARGGHVHILNLDCSAYGVGLTAPKKMFNLRGAVHSEGVQSFSVKNMRVEAKSDHFGLLHCEWGAGNVTLDQVDISSQLFLHNYGEMIRAKYNSLGGAHIVIRDSHMAGTIAVEWESGDSAYRHRLKVENTTWREVTGPADVVTFDPPGDGGTDYPAVEFDDDCRGDDARAVWGATIAHRGESIQGLPMRRVAVRSKYGFENGVPMEVIIPVGGILTGARIYGLAGAGGGTAGTTPSIPIVNGEATTVGTVTGSGANSAGFNVAQALNYVPFNTAQATLTITPNIDNASAVLYLEGIW